MTIKPILLIALSLCLFISCNTSNDKAGFSGTFKGQFIDGPVNQLVSISAEIKFNGDNYEATNGTGKFTVEDSSKVKFSMTNIESMDYIANKVLNGEYNYVIKGDSLILTKIFPPVEHVESSLLIGYKNQYRLKRMK
nr:hypothetical protein [Pedobacter panaciterrae]